MTRNCWHRHDSDKEHQLQLNNERNINDAPDKEINYNSTTRHMISRAQQTQPSTWQPTPIFFFFFFLLLTCVVSQFKYVLTWMNQPPTWYLSTLCLRFFTLAFVPTCRHHDSHRHCRQTVTDLQFVHYCNEYLFNIATNNQRVYTHKSHLDRAHLHQIKESTKDKSHSYFLQSTCIQFATNLFFVTQFYLQSTCI